jgi:hypothetical protein
VEDNKTSKSPNADDKGHPKSELLKEGEDFYFNEDGLMVLTAKYLLARGYCCGNQCKHCPYKDVP